MRILLGFLGAFAFLAGSAQADLVSLPLLGLPAYQYGGYYVGPLQGTDGTEALDFWCDDFTHETVVPTTYYADISSIPSTTARFSLIADSSQKYNEIAWLIGQYYLMSNKTNQSVGDLQFAIWSVFDPSETVLQTPGAINWLTTAQSLHLSSFQDSGARIFTPVDCSGPNCAPTIQEFVSPGSVPEPTSILLLATSILTALFVIRKKRFGQR